MADVNNLIKTEGKIINILQLLIDAEKEKIAAIEEYVPIIHIYRTEYLHMCNCIFSYIAQFTDVYDKPGVDVEKVVSHPINAFLLVKHLSADWEHLKRFLTYDLGAGRISMIMVTTSTTMPFC